MESLFFACCESKGDDMVLNYSHIEHAIKYGETYRDLMEKWKKGLPDVDAWEHFHYLDVKASRHSDDMNNVI